MIGLIQRVSEARVRVDRQCVAEITRGILLLLGFEKGEEATDIPRLVDRVVRYRIFPDPAGHMNLSLLDIGGELLVVPQFTLAANTAKGLRPSFSSAAAPDEAQEMFREFVRRASQHCRVQAGIFGADMKVELINDGPVTFVLQV